MTKFSMKLLSTAAIGLTSIVSTASAADVEKKFAWSGQVNRMITIADDGEDTTMMHSDGQMSGTRARMKASAKSSSMTIGATIELAMQAGANVAQTGNGADSLSIRHSYVHISNSMGKLDIGDTAHAGESFAGTDVSGTGMADGISTTAFDAVLFKDSGSLTGAPAAGVSVATGHGSDISGGRQSGISYTAPSFNGFKAKVSVVNDNTQSGELTYGGDFNGLKLKAGINHINMGDTVFDSKTGYGVGLTVKNGLNISYNYKEEELDSENSTQDDPSVHYAKIGYKMKGLSSLGGTSLSVSYRKAEDMTLTGDDYQSYGFQFVQSLSDYGTSVYGGYSNMAYDTEAADFEDIDGVFMGMRVVF